MLKAENKNFKSRLMACESRLVMYDGQIETCSIESALSSENSSSDADNESENKTPFKERVKIIQKKMPDK